MKTLVLAILFSGLTLTAIAQQPYTPARGDTVRKALMDGLRAHVRDVEGLDRSIVFKVHKLGVLNGWALMTVTPLTPEGTRIAAYEENLPCDLEIIALLRYQDEQWTVVERDVGPCDFAWDYIFDQNEYPEPLFDYWMAQEWME